MEQIKQGAPSDVFISAGASQMKELDTAGLIKENTSKSLVKNALVLIGPKDTSLTSFSDLTTDKVTHIGVGEPSSVPAGKYADETLTKMGIKDKVTSKLVFAKDVKEVLAWSASGNTEAGFAYLSDAKGNDTVKIIETIPEDMHSPIIYPIGIIKSSKNFESAKIFKDYLFTDEAQKIFEDYGYSLIK
jgi:molybdate transport system substrate-binding protein